MFLYVIRYLKLNICFSSKLSNDRLLLQLKYIATNWLKLKNNQLGSVETDDYSVTLLSPPL